MAASGSSMLYSFLLFVAVLSLQEVYRGKLASSELFTILGGFSSSLIFLFLLTRTLGGLVLLILASFGSVLWHTIDEKSHSSVSNALLNGCKVPLWKLVHVWFLGNYQETIGVKSGWGAVIFAEAVALIAASTVHRVCITTCFLFSAGLLYEINNISGMSLSKSESKSKRF